MFSATGAGFHITFDNGWTISVQWGPGNYGDNRMKSLEEENFAEVLSSMESRTAEIMAWDANDVHWDFSVGSRVGLLGQGLLTKGWVKPDELIGYIQEISQI